MPSAGLLAFLITFTSFNSMQAKHFLDETKDNAEAGKRPNYLRFILGTLPFPSRNPSLKYLLSDLVSQCGPFTRYDQLGPFFVVSVLLVLVFKKFVLFFSQNLMLVLQIPPFSQMPRKRWTWLHPMTCVIPVRRWSWKARWENTDFFIIGTKAWWQN